MGRSSYAKIAFGIPLSEDQDPKFLEEYDGDFESFIEDISPYPKYREPGHNFKDRDKFKKEMGVDLILYGSYDYPLYFLAVPETEDTVEWGAKEINFKNIPDDARDKLKAFWDKYVDNPYIEYDQYEEKPVWKEPSWHFMSLYG